MGQLVTYLQGLGNGNNIDRDISSSIIQTNSLIKRSNNWAHMRFANRDYNFVYLPWFGNGVISYCEVDPNQDILSFPFSGCYLARITAANSHIAYHIHSDVSPLIDQKGNWNSYIYNIRALVGNITGSLFKPDLRQHNLPANYNSVTYRLWGIISDITTCYSALVDVSNSNQWVLHSFVSQNSLPSLIIM